MTDAADDLEALFDEVAAQRTESLTAQTAEPPAAASAQDEPDIQGAETVEPVSEAASEEAQPGTMYERLGGIVRMLHDSLRELGYDRSLSNVATQINDAQDRLAYVASLTEQAATKVLNAVDSGMPAQDDLARQAKEMDTRWTRLFEGQLSIEEFKVLAGDSRQFATVVMQASDAEKARLLEIMMAQDFQDITGQLIKKIITITNTVERELAQLLRDNAPPEVKAAIAAEQSKQEDLMQGPAAPGKAMAQDDVDSLLADLGF